MIHVVQTCRDLLYPGFTKITPQQMRNADFVFEKYSNFVLDCNSGELETAVPGITKLSNTITLKDPAMMDHYAEKVKAASPNLRPPGHIWIYSDSTYSCKNNKKHTSVLAGLKDIAPYNSYRVQAMMGYTAAQVVQAIERDLNYLEFTSRCPVSRAPRPC